MRKEEAVHPLTTSLTDQEVNMGLNKVTLYLE